MVDHNGGNVMSGDAVSLQFGPWSVTATNGGGSTVTVAPTTGSPWETFTIVKLSGAPGTRILNGDRVAFQTTNGNYLSALGNGGGSVTATPTSAGGPETFIYIVH